MSLTQERQDWLDEQPSFHNGGRIHFFRAAGEVEHRSAVRPRFPRRERAENLNRIHEWILEREERS
jgi:hypothetical protein